MAYDPYDEKEQIQIKLLNNTIDLDQLCGCVESSRGYYRDEPDTVCKIKKGQEDCDYCEGRRFTLTSEGQAIMNLIRRHGK